MFSTKERLEIARREKKFAEGQIMELERLRREELLKIDIPLSLSYKEFVLLMWMAKYYCRKTYSTSNNESTMLLSKLKSKLEEYE